MTHNNILIKKLKLKRNMVYQEDLRTAINKVKQLMGQYNDTSHDLDEGEPIIVSYLISENPIKYNYFLAIGRWIAQQPSPVIIPLYNIESIENYDNNELEAPLDLDSLYYSSIQKYFVSKDNVQDLCDRYILDKTNGASGQYKILVSQNGQISLLRSTGEGEVDIDKVMITPGSLTAQLQIEYIDPVTGDLVKKDKAETQDEFNYFIYSLLSWKNY